MHEPMNVKCLVSLNRSVVTETTKIIVNYNILLVRIPISRLPVTFNLHTVYSTGVKNTHTNLFFPVIFLRAG